MTFTTTTIKKLRALNLEQHIFDAVLEIFEEAKDSRPKKKVEAAASRVERETRLTDDWVLPAAWREWAMSIGMRMGEVDRERTKFKNYWLSRPGSKGAKLRWDLTWQNWCYKMLSDAGRQPIEAAGASVAEGPQAFTDATWRAIAKRVKAGSPWNPEWGPGPDRMDCMMPGSYL